MAGACPFQFVRVFADGAPRPFRRTGPFGQRHLRHPVGEPLVRHRRRTHPVRVDELRREALKKLRSEKGIVEGAEGAVGVHVYETGCQREPSEVDGPARFGPHAGTHRYYDAVVDCDISRPGLGIAGVDRRISQEQFHHPPSLPGRGPR